MNDSHPLAKPWTEAERQAALDAYDILDSAAETPFDDIVEIAARVCEAPVALVSLIDRDRQWFKARLGLQAEETPRNVSFCSRAIELEGDLVVTDASADPRFKDNPLVTGDPHIRFYAGATLRTAAGVPLGTLCVIDTEPRHEGLSETQKRTLQVLAKQVMTELELRRVRRAGINQKLSHDLQDAERDERDVELARIALALAESEARLRAISESMPQMVWSSLPDGFVDYYNARWYEFTGVPEGTTDGEAWGQIVHPEDQSLTWARWSRALETGELYEIEYRLRHRSGVYRWTLGRALPIRDAEGRIIRWFGTCTDIEDIKRHEAEREAVSQELNHRIKNVFAVVSALVALSARQHPEARDFAASLKTRIQSLARAHEFVRPHTASAVPGSATTTLHAFLRELLAPYAAVDGGTLNLEGDDAVFDDQAATPVALLFHELATNAAKYGALSVADGRVTIRSSDEGDGFRLEWIESGGPLIDRTPQHSGFGFTLARLAVEGQLGGSLEQLWLAEGLHLIAILPVAALQRRRHAAGSVEPESV